MLETALETTLTLKLRIRPLIIEALNFDEKLRVEIHQPLLSQFSLLA